MDDRSKALQNAEDELDDAYAHIMRAVRALQIADNRPEMMTRLREIRAEIRDMNPSSADIAPIDR